MNYTITVEPKNASTAAYSVKPSNISLRLGSNQVPGLTIPDHAAGQLHVGQPLQGKLLIDKEVFAAQQPKVLMFNVSEVLHKDKIKYLGVVLK